MSDQAIQIVADENINGLQYFEKLATVKKVRGRQISNDIIRSADALLIRSVTQVNRQLLEQSNVKFIASATSGIDHIDLDYLKKNNVEFAYAPGSNATSVVQYVFACLAQLSKKYDFDWRNKSVGIIGAGHVGGLLASYLEQLDMNFLIYDPLLGHKYAHSNKLTVLDKVLQQDVITVHTPLTWQEPYPTYHMFDKKMLRDFSRDKVLINTSRGGVFDNLALLDELQENKWKCVLDVWENEPDINLALLQEVEIGSSHIAGYSYEGKENGTAMIYQAFTDFFGFDDAPSYPLDRQHTALTFRPASTELAQINQTILSAYPVAKDHMQLLSLIDKKSGAGFDDLRRNYRLRREFSHFTLDYSALEDSAEKVLRILGFN